jgi:hypothetical protein
MLEGGRRHPLGVLRNGLVMAVIGLALTALFMLVALRGVTTHDPAPDIIPRSERAEPAGDGGDGD